MTDHTGLYMRVTNVLGARFGLVVKHGELVFLALYDEITYDDIGPEDFANALNELDHGLTSPYLVSNN